MKFVDEYRDPEAAQQYVDTLHKTVDRPLSIMEICGGQTHTIVKYGIDQLLPEQITLIHGPGCPVCVTPVEIIDQAIEIASKPNVIFCSFGDMLRVPGSEHDLFSVKAQGGDVRIVYSPLDALKLARENPDKQVIFFAVGFETTAPNNAMAALQAHREKRTNFSLLTSHVRVPPAMELILSSPANQIQGFLAAGHVCTIMGYEEYFSLAEKHHVPIVVTGFEPLDILQGITMCVKQLREQRYEVENQYKRTVHPQGNLHARKMISEVFKIVDRHWRGIGTIPNSGFDLREEFAQHDAQNVFDLQTPSTQAETECISGLILQGVKKPHECPAFGTRCTPETPLGAPMVSNEGACAAYYRYRRHEIDHPIEA